MVPNNFKLIKQDYIISNTSTNKKNLIPSNTANNVMRLKIGADCYLIKDANHNLSLSKLVSSSFTTANVSLNNNCCPTNDESKGTKIDNQCSRTKNHRSNTIPRATLAKMQRYSMGDYLRSLILEDLHSPDFIGKSEQQIAADRCIKIMKFFDNPEKKFRRKQFNNRCRDECNIRRYRSQSDANLKAMSYLINSRCFCCKLPMTVDNGINGSEVKENNDLATNYFRRVYEFLKQQPKDGRSSSAMGKWSYFHKNHQTDDEDGYEKSDDTSSSSCDAGKISQRRIINGFQGEEALCLHRTTDQEEEEEDDADSANFFRPQLRDIFDNKHRPRPPLPVKCRVNTRDISKYFDYPNKENRPGWCTSPPAKEMGSNLSRHHGKGLTGRRTQSSGNLCEPKGKINHVGKMLVPCSSTSSEERYKFSGSLPNYLDNDSNSLIDDLSDNNNTLADTICGNLGGTLPHKKPHYEQNHVKYHSHDSLEGDPWRYQQSNELDVVRCKHGTLDIVRRSNRDSHEHAFSSNTMVRHSNRSHPDLDIVAGTLPTRRIDPKWCDPAGIGPIHQRNPVDTVDGSFAKVVHKPDCELMKHRQVERCQAARKSKRIAGEHQDQGYASERSPEDEHPPVIAPDSGLNLDRTFRVTLQKSSRGLGLSVSGGGASGPIRIKRLFPQQPAALSNKLQPGDILLAANGVPLTSLTNYEALEVLRTSANTVELLVCRQPGENSITPPGAPPTPPARREAPRVLNPVTPLNIEPCGEFDIEMTKVEGSLGFTLRKVDSSALGHYVRALVREPALSDGRIQPGDKIVAVDGAPLSPMSHEEAVALLRQCGPKVKLRLYRDLAQTPVSALSPTEPDHPLHLSRTSLRQEAMDMLCDLAVRKLSPSASDGLGNQNTANATSSSPRKLRKPRTPSKERSNDTNHVSTVVQTDPTDSDDYSNLLNSTSSGTAADSDASRAARPKFLDLSSSSDRTDIQFGLDTSSECRDRFISSMIHPVDAEYALYKRDVIAGVIQDNNLPTEPVSMPPVSCDATFSYKNPAYQSANPTCSGSDHIKGKAAAYSSDQNIPGRLSGSDDPAGNKGLLKWKGVMFAPDDSNCSEKDAMQNNNLREINPVKEDCEIFMVELTRGWNSRLGFSLQAHENGTIISMVHPDSVAAKDGRLKQGDILLMVNDESVTDVPTNEIIDLLRKIRGSIGITVARKKKQSVT